MMSSVLSRQTCVLIRAIQHHSKITAALSNQFSSTSVRQSRDRFYLRDEAANVSLPDTSYSGMIQNAQGREHEFSANRAKDTVDMSSSDVDKSMSEEAQSEDDVHAQHYDDSCNVSLHSCMQSNVPEPYSGGSPTHLNMPGSGAMQRQRFESNRRVDVKTPKRDFHTSSFVYNEGAQPLYGISREDFQPPAAQGVQGDIDNDCLYKLWLENCHRYNLDCDEMLQGVQSGRKTLSQVFAEQDKLIRKVAQKSTKRN